ncbi:MAG: SPOR domain-containing protein [Paracoccaceae bacterium]
MTVTSFRNAPARRGGILLAMALGLAGCGEEGGFGLLQPRDGESRETGEREDARSVRLVERDTEAPEVFQVSEAGLWDGRPSLGGVWVAHPDATDPERVIIRNDSNDKFVIGALFQRERENPGPRLQVSSDAADALGMLAGKPANLEVTALRREEVSETGEDEDASGDDTDATLSAPAEVSESALDPAGAAAAALEGDEAAEAEAAEAGPEARPARASGLDRPYIQIGIFSVEDNARNTATAMRQAGMVPALREQSSRGKTFWRVLVGPAATAEERATLLDRIRDSGFTDAYAVAD